MLYQDDEKYIFDRGPDYVMVASIRPEESKVRSFIVENTDESFIQLLQGDYEPLVIDDEKFEILDLIVYYNISGALIHLPFNDVATLVCRRGGLNIEGFRGTMIFASVIGDEITSMTSEQLEGLRRWVEHLIRMDDEA